MTAEAGITITITPQVLKDIAFARSDAERWDLIRAILDKEEE